MHENRARLRTFTLTPGMRTLKTTEAANLLNVSPKAQRASSSSEACCPASTTRGGLSAASASGRSVSEHTEAVRSPGGALATLLYRRGVPRSPPAHAHALAPSPAEAQREIRELLRAVVLARSCARCGGLRPA
jgi:hypothetical protein